MLQILTPESMFIVVEFRQTILSFLEQNIRTAKRVHQLRVLWNQTRYTDKIVFHCHVAPQINKRTSKKYYRYVAQQTVEILASTRVRSAKSTLTLARMRRESTFVLPTIHAYNAARRC